MVIINILCRINCYIYWETNAFALVSIAIILDFVLEVFYHTFQ